MRQRNLDAPRNQPLASRGRWFYALLVAGAGFLLLLGALLRAAGGVQGSYYSRTSDGRDVLVHTRIDPAIDFPLPQRLDAAYLFHWNVGTWGVPEERPPYLIRWSGVLQAPSSGQYGFQVDARGEAVLRIDGTRVGLAPDTVTVRDLQAGLHRIELDYASSEGEARIVLRWQPPGASLRAIPAASLGVDGAAIAGARFRRLAGWWLLAAGLAAALLIGARRRLWGTRPGAGAAADGTAGEAAAGTPFLLPADRSRLAFGAILALAALLRFHDYALVPLHNETADEYQHAWEGWHLLHTGDPVSWSFFAAIYPREQIYPQHWFGNGYLLVRPYFDHPPLMSILVGVVCTLAGAGHFLECSLPVMRLVPIALSLAGLFLLRRLALVYGASERGALLAALVYAVLPNIVLAHRLAKAENLLTLLFMGAVLLAERHARSGRAVDAVLAGFLCGLSLWTKATGIAVVATVFVLLLSRRRHRGAALALLVTAGFGLLYLAYAWACDFRIFLEIIRIQSTSKWASFEGFLDLLQGRVVEASFGTGFHLWLLLAAAVAAFRKGRALLIPLAIYAGLLVLMGDFRGLYGWTRIPLYPFLCVAAGLYLEEMIEASDLARVFPFAMTAVLTGLTLVLPEALAESRPAVLLFALIAVVPYVARFLSDSRFIEQLARAATFALLALFLLTCLGVVGQALEIYVAATA